MFCVRYSFKKHLYDKVRVIRLAYLAAGPDSNEIRPCSGISLIYKTWNELTATTLEIFAAINLFEIRLSEFGSDIYRVAQKSDTTLVFESRQQCFL